MTDLSIYELARAASGVQSDNGQRFVAGTIAAVASTGVTVSLSGGGGTVPAALFLDWIPLVGDPVLCMWDGPRLIVVGTLRDGAAGDWQAASYTSPWASYATSDWSQARYRRERDIVRIEGLVKTTSNVTFGATIFTLPVGYRPPKILTVATFGYPTGGPDMMARINVDVSGNVTMVTMPAATFPTTILYLSLHGITFSMSGLNAA